MVLYAGFYMQGSVGAVSFVIEYADLKTSLIDLKLAGCVLNGLRHSGAVYGRQAVV